MRLRKRRSEVILTLLYDSSMPRYFPVVRKAMDCPAIFANAAVDAAAQVWPPPRQVLRHHRCSQLAFRTSSGMFSVFRSPAFTGMAPGAYEVDARTGRIAVLDTKASIRSVRC